MHHSTHYVVSLAMKLRVKAETVVEPHRSSDVAVRFFPLARKEEAKSLALVFGNRLSR